MTRKKDWLVSALILFMLTIAVKRVFANQSKHAEFCTVRSDTQHANASRFVMHTALKHAKLRVLQR